MPSSAAASDRVVGGPPWGVYQVPRPGALSNDSTNVPPPSPTRTRCASRVPANSSDPVDSRQVAGGPSKWTAVATGSSSWQTVFSSSSTYRPDRATTGTVSTSSVYSSIM